MRPVISSDKIVTPKSYETWTMSLMGKPKVSMICGNCDWFFKSRDWITLYANDRPVGSLIGCPSCHKYNRIPYYF
jgi:hypothetical protein